MDLLTKQREERKRRILEVARRLIAEHGYQGVTMRELANESLVSVPTLYNLFGGKNELLFAAVETYFVNLLGSGDRDDTQEGLSRIIALAEGICRETVRHAAYTRSLLSFLGGPSDIGGLHEFVAAELANELVAALEEMQRTRQLAAWADIQVLGERLAGQLTITTFEWAAGQLSDEGFRGAVLYGTAVLLLGVARGSAANELERLVRKFQKAAASGRQPSSRRRHSVKTKDA
jgi:AcrR family transcriptional regulator